MVEAVLQKKPSFFLNKMGPTLEVLAFFSSSRVSRLLHCLCKKGKTFVDKNRQNIFQSCVPSIFDCTMTQLPTIEHLNQEVPVLKVAHLREGIFVVGYVSGLLELVDFDNTQAEGPLDSF